MTEGPTPSPVELARSLRKAVQALNGAEATRLPAQIVPALAVTIPLLQATPPGDPRRAMLPGLMDRLGELLRRLDRPRDAMTVFAEGARVAAEEPPDKDLTRYFRLKRAQAAMDAMQLRDAGESLAQALGVDGWARIAQAEDDPRRWRGGMACPQDLPSLGLVTMGRFLAATGSLTEADRRLGDARVRLEEVSTKGDARRISQLDPAELRLFNAEVRADRGDLSGAAALLSPTWWVDRPEAQRGRVGILAAQVAIAAGRYSEGLQRLDAERPEGLDPKALNQARMLRIQCLGILNRLDEAQADLLSLRLSRQGPAPAELLRLDALIQARRDSAPLDVDGPPTLSSLLTPGLHLNFAPPPLTVVDETAGSLTALAPRRQERVWHWFGSEAAEILLCLQDERLEAAASRLAFLLGELRAVDAPRITAALRRLEARVAYFTGDLAYAMEAGEDALMRYQALHILPEQVDLCTLLRWCLARLNQDLPRQRALALLRSDVLTEVEGRLSPFDTRMYRLNKTSILEESIAQLCGAHLGVNRLRSSDSRSLRRLLHTVHALRHQALTSAAPGSASEQAQAQGDALPMDAYSRHLLQAIWGATSNAFPYIGRFGHRWLARDAAIIRFVVLTDRLYVFVITASGVEMLKPQAAPPRTELWSAMASAMRLLGSEISWNAAVKLGAADQNGLRRMSDHLGLPAVVACLPPRVRRLIFVPDDILSGLPFAALPLDQKTPLVRRYDVSVCLTPYAALEPEAPSLHPGAEALGVMVERSRAEHALSPVPATKRAIARLSSLATRQCDLLVDRDASRAAVLAALPAAHHVWWSCHGRFSAQDPFESGLLLDDGWLTLRQIARCDLGLARLHVVGACHGGEVHPLFTAEHIGLPATLLSRGARAVIAPVLRVGDVAAADFLDALHGALPNTTPQAALGQTQRDALDTGAPLAHWAGYVHFIGGHPLRTPLRWLMKIHRRFPWAQHLIDRACPSPDLEFPHVQTHLAMAPDPLGAGFHERRTPDLP